MAEDLHQLRHVWCRVSASKLISTRAGTAIRFLENKRTVSGSQCQTSAALHKIRVRARESTSLFLPDDWGELRTSNCPRRPQTCDVTTFL